MADKIEKPKIDTIPLYECKCEIYSLKRELNKPRVPVNPRLAMISTIDGLLTNIHASNREIVLSKIQRAKN